MGEGRQAGDFETAEISNFEGMIGFWHCWKSMPTQGAEVSTDSWCYRTRTGMIENDEK
jgi:hypothetical protein